MQHNAALAIFLNPVSRADGKAHPADPASCPGGDAGPQPRASHTGIAIMVAVRTPLRVGLFGGGTDYPAYFRREPGAVLGFTIDRYLSVRAEPLPAAVDYRYRLSYSKRETVDSVAAIEHPVVRTVLQRRGFDEPTDFSVQADLPASAGLGSSSAFTVSMLSLISHLMGSPTTPMELAREAIHIEQVLLQENVGVQDQLHASFGGINRFDLCGDSFRVTPVALSASQAARLADWMVLVYTRVRPRASAVVAEQIRLTEAGSLDAELREMRGLVDAAQQALENAEHRDDTPVCIGRLLHQSWQIKKRLSSRISTPAIDALYEFCLGNGAIGGKLCGAGGGGFLLMVVPPERRRSFETEIGERHCVRFRIASQGAMLISPMSSPTPAATVL
jgi:D-glycero-alpha-D-manno-heptose-7-phosphate kinase